MKVKRQKTHRKLMQLYCASFNFREPYQLVVDGTMVHVALQFRIDLRTVVPSTLAAETKLFTTPCVIAELRQLGQDYLGAVLASNRFEARRCGHAKGTSAAQCLKDLVGTDNPHHLMIGTQDAALRAHLRSVPGVPLMYLSSSVLVLEPHSPETLERVKDQERAKVHASAKELDKLQKKAEADGVVTPADSARPIGAMPKRKKVKGPNPLAIKKKKKEPAAAAPASSKDKDKSKQPKQDKRPKESEPAAPSTQQDMKATTPESSAPESSAPNEVPAPTAVTAPASNEAAAPAKRKRDSADDDKADEPAAESTAANGSAAKKRRKRGGVRRKKKATDADADGVTAADEPAASGDDE
ncbi:Small subunit processome component [Allomyces javanicus]|nr:Small subunit processome component [Allomyces javanicus]